MPTIQPISGKGAAETLFWQYLIETQACPHQSEKAGVFRRGRLGGTLFNLFEQGGRDA
jgi:hypothetical protein